jgi:hypothetical protein
LYTASQMISMPKLTKPMATAVMPRKGKNIVAPLCWIRKGESPETEMARGLSQGCDAF